ncbi:cysteine hydrolase family protein [Companilactobacillus alimentarius]|uniref:Cysteine hydrolase n=1 Tax=Companilactobacillus alimentarius DSM 20249 TaxID=1423720 RepID=A0A2K9HIR8_9LACO|nr:cysteine hydrolase family protein [Companilactobacillus alimentarius]AUI72429.1 cysteine hydrolase [Companilactobacillus alimentarius DSM 20249]MDT6953016.1 cysteine hydrolase family protein [Companilactobacillus alimentarius]GEO44954.1 amidase [Companilactobacillus alimentarius]
MPKLAEALIVIDMQKALQYSYNFNDLINRINQRIAKYRQSNLPIIFIQHNDSQLVRDSDLWELSKRLDRKPDDLVVEKTHPNAFYKTDFEKILKENHVNTLEICGAQTEYCCNATIVMAHGLGYKLIMEHDMTTTFDNNYMIAEDTISFFENIWSERFLTFQ